MRWRRSQISALPVLIIIGIVFSSVHLGIEAQVHCDVTRNGGDADLMCKIPSDMDIVQVTWKKRTGNSYETMVAHSKTSGVQISKPYENRLSVLETKDPGTSAIALSQLEKEDDACFTAIFNIFPGGALKGEVCLPKLRIAAQVQCNVTRNGGKADLICEIPSHMDIVRVIWQRRTGNSYETLVTHSKRSGVKISKPYENRLSVLQTKDPGTSAIALSQLEKEDDACFTAIFKLFPHGALKGEVCLPKLRGVREITCKSPADFSVTLDPPEIKTQHSEPNGNIIQKGRWLNDGVSPVCNFQLRQKARTRRIFAEDGDEIFTIECNASGTQRLTITWRNEGQPISKEEKVIITGDLITVTSTRHHSLSTLPEEKATSCNISYDKDIDSVKCEESHHEKNEGPSMDRIIIVSIAAVLLLSALSVGICVMLCNLKRFLIENIFKRKQLNSSKKEDNAKEGSTSPLKQHNLNKARTRGVGIKQRKASSVKQNRENIQRNNHESLTYIDEVSNGIPGSETKQRNSSSQKKKNKSVIRLFY